MPTSSLLSTAHSNHNKASSREKLDDPMMSSLAFQFQSSVHLSNNNNNNNNKSISASSVSPPQNQSSGGVVVPSTNSAGQTIEDMMLLRGLKTTTSSQNVTESVPVPSSEHVAEIVGRQGCKIKALRAQTNTSIKTPVRGEPPMFVITGRKEDVHTAKNEIQLAADHFSQIRARRGSSSSSGSGNGNACGTGFAPQHGCHAQTLLHAETLTLGATSGEGSASDHASPASSPSLLHAAKPEQATSPVALTSVASSASITTLTTGDRYVQALSYLN